MSLVIAMYRPHPGREDELENLIRKHVPTLRDLELATSRPPILARSARTC